jgi:hypothetical protein
MDEADWDVSLLSRDGFYRIVVAAHGCCCCCCCWLLSLGSLLPVEKQEALAKTAARLLGARKIAC